MSYSLPLTPAAGFHQARPAAARRLRLPFNLHNVSIRAQIYALLSFVFLLFGITVLLLLTMTRNISISNAHFSNYEVKFSDAAQDLLTQGLQKGQALRNVLLNPSDTTGLQNYERAQLNYGKALEIAMTLAPSISPVMEQKLRAVAANTPAHEAIAGRVLELARTGRSAEGKAVLVAEETPAWRTIGADLMAILDASGDLSAQTSASIARDVQRSFIMGLSLLAFTLMVGGAASILLVSRILATINRVVMEAEDISNGHLSDPVVPPGTNELGMLLISIEIMRQHLTGAVG